MKMRDYLLKTSKIALDRESASFFGWQGFQPVKVFKYPIERKKNRTIVLFFT
jgi:hypothetical protein